MTERVSVKRKRVTLPEGLSVQDTISHPLVLRQLRRDAFLAARNSFDLEEILQRTVLYALEKHQTTKPENLIGWLRTIIYQEARIYYREQDAWQSVPAEWNWSYQPSDDYSESLRKQDKLLLEAREILGATPDQSTEALLKLVATRDKSRAQRVTQPETRACKRGHVRSVSNTRYAADGTVRCLACNRASAARKRQKAAAGDG